MPYTDDDGNDIRCVSCDGEICCSGCVVEGVDGYLYCCTDCREDANDYGDGGDEDGGRGHSPETLPTGQQKVIRDC